MTSPGTTVSTLNIGDTVPIGTVMANLIIMGIVTDINNPNMFGATMQSFQANAVLTVPVLQGDQGDPGQPSFALRFQNDILASPSDLPNNLTNAATDLGKYWVFKVTDQNGNAIATTMYVWYGTSLGWQQFPIGTPGPTGPYPVITPHIVVEEPGNAGGPGGADSWIAVTGTVSNPVYTYHIAAPTGVPGPVGALAAMPDIDFITNEPNPGDMLVCSARTTPSVPNGLIIAPSGTGGTFAAGQYFWSVTAVLPNGTETMASNEVTTTFVGSTSSALLTWNEVAGAGAVAYKIYRGTSATNLSVLVATVEGVTNTSYIDTGSAGTPASPPSANVVAGRNIWVPKAQTPVVPLLYTIPQAAFTSTFGIGAAKQPVASFAVPAQPWAWKPYVFGAMQIFGSSISFSPFLIGGEVLLGDPTTGTLVASGEGNSQGSVTLIPQASSSKNPSTAMTPSNKIGLVNANHTGAQGTLYVNLLQQGFACTYDFNADGAQLVVLVVPVLNPPTT